MKCSDDFFFFFFFPEAYGTSQQAYNNIALTLTRHYRLIRGTAFPTILHVCPARTRISLRSRAAHRPRQRLVNQNVDSYSQTVANFPFTCDSFR